MSIISHCIKNTENIDIKVVHFLIGCKTNTEKFQTVGGIIHEFPKLSRVLLENPKKLFDNAMCSYSDYKKVIRIHQVLYLIDPLYEKTEPVFTNAGITAISNNGHMIHRYSDYTVISTIEIFIYPVHTNTSELNILIDITKKSNCLINIQDTTGSDMCKHIKSDSQINILISDCALNTSGVYACPPISFLDKPRWVNIRDDAMKLFIDSFTGDEYVIDYLKSVTQFIFCKRELVALSRLWSLNDLGEEINHVLTGKIKLSDVTCKTYNANYKLCILPYVSHRCTGNIVYDQILYFLDTWNTKYMYSDSDLKFIDIIKEECDVRISILGDEYTTYRDLVNIISKRVQMVNDETLVSK